MLVPYEGLQQNSHRFFCSLFYVSLTFSFRTFFIGLDYKLVIEKIFVQPYKNEKNVCINT